MVFFPSSSGFWLPLWCLLFLTQSENVTAILNFESLLKVTTLLLEYFWQCRRLHIKSKIFQAIRGQGGHLGFRIAHKRHNTSSGPYWSDLLCMLPPLSGEPLHQRIFIHYRSVVYISYEFFITLYYILYTECGTFFFFFIF